MFARLRIGKSRCVLGTLAVLGAITYLDGTATAARVSGSQAISTIVVCGWWLLLYRNVGDRLRRSMLIGVVMATLGEMFFCLLVGMYEYRLGNIPWYVPPGHTVLYVTNHLLGRDPWVRRHQGGVVLLLSTVAAGFSIHWLRAENDVFGFGCFCAIALLALAVPRSRLFFVSMYLLVAALELQGTHWGCWRWQPTWLGHWTRIPSGNPPSGVALFYVLYDLSCLGVYFFLRWTSFERWIQRRIWRTGLRAARE